MKFVTNNELKLLRLTMCLAFVVLIYNLVSIRIEIYNNEVKYEQLRKEEEANTGRKQPKFSLTECNFYFHERARLQSRSITFFVYLFSILWLFRKRIKKFGLITFAVSLSFSHFLYWFNDTQQLRANLIEMFGKTDEDFQGSNAILLNSNYLDVVQFAVTSLILIWLLSILLRFVIERFQAKISLR